MAPCLSRAERDTPKRLQSASREAGEPGNFSRAICNVSVKRLVGI